VLTRRPPEFGFARNRLSCEAVAVVKREDRTEPASREAVRRWLHGAGLVWRRPRPAPRRQALQRRAKLNALWRLLHGLPADETAVFMNEVDIDHNPKVDPMWAFAWFSYRTASGSVARCARLKNDPTTAFAGHFLLSYCKSLACHGLRRAVSDVPW
jgi:hypothetical protein